MDTIYTTSSGNVEALVHLKECLTDESRFSTCDWAQERVYGWVIGYESSMQCLGVSILHWDKTNKRLDYTTTTGVVGAKAPLEKRIEDAARDALRDDSGRCVPLSAEAMDLKSQILQDMQSYIARLQQSPIYAIMQDTIDAIQNAPAVDPTNVAALPDTLALGYWEDEHPDAEMHCNCGAVHSKGIDGRLQVYDIAKVLRDTQTIVGYTGFPQELVPLVKHASIDISTPWHPVYAESESLIMVLTDAGYHPFTKEDGTVVLREEHRELHIPPGKFGMLILPHSICLSNYRRATVPQQDMSIYEPLLNRAVSVETFDTYGIPKSARIIPHTMATRYLDAMAIVQDLRHALSDIAHEALKPADESWEDRKEKEMNRMRVEHRAELFRITSLIRNLLVSESIDEKTVVPGMNIGFAESYSAGGIRLNLGKVLDVRKSGMDGEHVFDTDTEQYQIDMDLGLKIRYASIERMEDGWGGCICNDSTPYNETQYQYYGKNAAFSWTGSLEHRLFNPAKSIEAQASEENMIVNTETVGTDEGWDVLHTGMSLSIPDGPEGAFVLPKFFAFDDEILKTIREAILAAEAKFS